MNGIDKAIAKAKKEGKTYIEVLDDFAILIELKNDGYLVYKDFTLLDCERCRLADGCGRSYCASIDSVWICRWA